MRKKVVIFFGLIASGKSFIAKAWAERHSLAYYNTDVVRKQLAGIGVNAVLPEEAVGLYSSQMTRMTYEQMLNLAEMALNVPGASCVVLDGSYQAQVERERVQKRFADQAQIIFIMCDCREEITKARLAQRALDPTAISDATWEVYLHQKELFEYPEELPFCQFRRLPTNKEVGRLLQDLDEILLDL